MTVQRLFVDARSSPDSLPFLQLFSRIGRALSIIYAKVSRIESRDRVGIQWVCYRTWRGTRRHFLADLLGDFPRDFPGRSRNSSRGIGVHGWRIEWSRVFDENPGRVVGFNGTPRRLRGSAHLDNTIRQPVLFAISRCT